MRKHTRTTTITLAITTVAVVGLVTLASNTSSQSLPVDTVCGVSTDGSSTTIELTHGKRMWVAQKYDQIWLLGETIRLIHKGNHLIDFRGAPGKLIDPKRFSECQPAAYNAPVLSVPTLSNHVTCGARIVSPTQMDVLTDRGVYRKLVFSSDATLGIGELNQLYIHKTTDNRFKLDVVAAPRNKAGEVIDKPQLCANAGTQQLPH